MFKKMLGIFGLSVISLSLLIPSFAQAATFRATPGEGTETLSVNENLKNVYAAASTVNSDAKIQGDMVVAGSTINIDGAVSESLFAAAQNSNVKGTIGSNARLLGSTVNFDGKAGQDLLAAGNTVTTSNNSMVSGDALLAAQTLVVNGVVNGNAWLCGGDVTINGKIAGDVTLKNVEHLTIGSGAEIGGKLTYYSPNVASIASGASIKGATEHKTITQKSVDKNSFSNALELFSAGALVVTFLTLIVIVYLFPKSSRIFSEKSLSDFWAKLGWGFVALVIVPVATIILFTTLVGVYLGFLALGIYILLLCIAKILSAVLIGAQILKWTNRKEIRMDWLTALIGSIAVYILGFIPIVGWLILFGFMLVAFGQLSLGIVDIAKSER